jgi:hypothetical protein
MEVAGMQKYKKAALAAVMAGGMLLGAAAPAFATGEEPPATAKCNSGRGNASETTPANDCDPGNSGGHNNGGD